ncbi:MAG TPA: PTS sugar transporter subunit IIA [Spirochaetota bacterium]|nr:PTS sugar transporter subunit IIA [Spirochaetota bacterium]
MNITEVITEEYICPALVSEDKDELFAELVEVLVRARPGLDREAILKAIREREVKMSTGIGKGIAIPHGKTNVVDDLCGVIGISRKGVEYDALDGEPVHVVFMLLAPMTSAGRHIKALQKIANLMKDRGCYQRLCDAKTAAEVWQLIHADEERLAESGD